MSARDVNICLWGDCHLVAAYGDFCFEHREPPGPRLAATPRLSDVDYARLRVQVAADAAPLFLLAMNFLLSREVQALAEEAAALEAGS